MELSRKYDPLFKIPHARSIVQDPKFKAKYSRAEQRYWLDLAGVSTVVVTGGRFSVKSFAVSTAACVWARDHNHRILFTRFTMTSATDSIIPEFREKIDLLDVKEDFNETKDRITSNVNKSKIVFKGIKTSQGNMTASLKSLKDFSCFILDEAEEMPSYEDWEKIMLSIRASDVQNINVIVMNPAVREHWVFQEFFEDSGVAEGFNGIKDDVLYIHTTYKDCPREFIPEKTLKKFKDAEKDYDLYLNTPKELRDSLRNRVKKRYRWYKNVVMGGWMDAAEGVIYEDWKTGEFNEDLPHLYGLDFGSNDPDALVKVAVDHDKMQIHVHEEFFKNNQGTAQLMEVLHNRVGIVDLIMGDSAERRMIRDYQKGMYSTTGEWLGGVNIKATKKKSVSMGIKTIQGYTIVVTPESHNIIKALRNYTWNDQRAGVPRHEYSDLMDAIRYGALKLIFY